jgi:hypothetical protein
MTEQDISPHKVQFLPFHAINEFMRNDYRLSVVRAALNALPNLPTKFRQPINQATRRYVKVPGFRNPEKAPTAIKVLPMAKAFEKSPELVAAIIATWAEVHVELRQQVYELLKARGWKLFPEDLSLESLSLDAIREWAVLPIEFDRTSLPGFVATWPKDNNFETLYKVFTEMYPNANEGIDNVGLMVVWLSMRLPVNVEEAEEQLEIKGEGEMEVSPGRCA